MHKFIKQKKTIHETIPVDKLSSWILSTKFETSSYETEINRNSEIDEWKLTWTAAWLDFRVRYIYSDIHLKQWTETIDKHTYYFF